MPPAVARENELRQYFTDALEVSSAMATLLGDVQGKSVLEPSVGSGSLLEALSGRPSHIDAVDVDPAVLAHARRRLSALALKTHCTDFIDLFASGLLASRPSERLGIYDAVISNPPFGLYFSPDYRRHLKRLFPDFYVRESYGLFFIFSLMCLKKDGRYVFLLPDTFLTSKNHAPLRRFILKSAAPSYIVRFPSKRFETVNFGYGHLCILAGRRSAVAPDDVVRWIDAFDASRPILRQLSESMTTLNGGDLREHSLVGWRRGMSQPQSGQIGWKTLGEIAACKTGIYTGDNRQFIGYDPARVSRRLNGHAIIWNRQVCLRNLELHEQREGLRGETTYVPLVRGGHRRFSESTAWALRWDADAIASYRTDKKARLQNASYYFKSGLAVPMVTSRRLSASLLDGAVFDQGVVGVFPHSPNLRPALLLYLNSGTASQLRNDIVNGSANNSANYLKRLPVPNFSDTDAGEAKAIVANAIATGTLSEEACDRFVAAFTTKRDNPSG